MHSNTLSILISLLKVIINSYSKLQMHKNSQALSGSIPILNVETWTGLLGSQKISMISILDPTQTQMGMEIGFTLRWALILNILLLLMNRLPRVRHLHYLSSLIS